MKDRQKTLNVTFFKKFSKKKCVNPNYDYKFTKTRRVMEINEI